MRISFLDQSRDQIRDSEPPIVCMINWARCPLFTGCPDKYGDEDDRSRGAEVVWIEWNKTNSLGVMVQVDEIEVKREEGTGGNHLDVLLADRPVRCGRSIGGSSSCGIELLI